MCLTLKSLNSCISVQHEITEYTVFVLSEINIRTTAGARALTDTNKQFNRTIVRWREKRILCSIFRYVWLSMSDVEFLDISVCPILCVKHCIHCFSVGCNFKSLVCICFNNIRLQVLRTLLNICFHCNEKKSE